MSESPHAQSYPIAGVVTGSRLGMGSIQNQHLLPRPRVLGQEVGGKGNRWLLQLLKPPPLFSDTSSGLRHRRPHLVPWLKHPHADC